MAITVKVVRVPGAVVELVLDDGATGTRNVPTSEAERTHFCLSDDEVVTLAQLAMRIEAHYSAQAGSPRPIDAEWAKDGDDGQLYIVQARPETVAANRPTGQVEVFRLKDYAGMSRRNPGMALMMLAAFLSLAGMPPFGGFVAKVFVFAAGVQAGYVWLVVIGIITSIIGVYYYLNAMKYVYLYRMPEQDEENHPVPLTRPYAIALVVLAIGVILIGTLFAPWFTWSGLAALNLY